MSEDVQIIIEFDSMNFSHNAYRFIQDTNFLYYVGVDLPYCACLIDIENNKTINISYHNHESNQTV